MREIRFAWRSLCRAPGFALVATGTLMLAILANVFVFSVLDALLLRPIDVREAERLVQLRNGPRSSGRMLTTSYPAFRDLRERNRTFEDLAAVYAYSEGVLRFGAVARKIRGCAVSTNYFDLLGVQPALGRFFHAEVDAETGAAPYVVLSDALWRDVFHAEPGVIGASVRLDRQALTVIGVASPRFHGTERLEWPDYWVAIGNAGAGELESRAHRAVTVIGRLAAEISVRQATDDLDGILDQLAREHPATDAPGSIRLIRPGLFGDDGDVIRGFLWGVGALALLLFTAACANLANVFAARAADRSRELALRVALGAGKSQLVRQLLAEALILAVVAGAAGCAGAMLLVHGLNHWEPAFGYGGQRLGIRLTMHAPVFAVDGLLAAGTALFFTAVPARLAWRADPVRALQGQTAATPRTSGLRGALLAVQASVCAMLVACSLVAWREAVSAAATRLGFEPDGAMLVAVDLRDTEPRVDVGETLPALLAALRAVPGVDAVGAAWNIPLGAGRRGVPVYAADTSEFRPDRVVLDARPIPISPGYLAAAGTRLVAGRDVSEWDAAEAPRVGIVNEAFARAMWGAGSAIGRRFALAEGIIEVVGVVEDGKYHDLFESPQPAMFLPWTQSPAGNVVFVVRSRRATGDLAERLRGIAAAAAPGAPVLVRTWNEALGAAMFPARAGAATLGILGCLGVMLAITGVFGMAAYDVSRRMREFGIRLALGAAAGHIVRAAIGGPVAWLAVGSCAGLLGGVFSSAWLRRIVYEADPAHPAVVLGAIAIMVVIGVGGCAWPVRRALHADPSALMREL